MDFRKHRILTCKQKCLIWEPCDIQISAFSVSFSVLICETVTTYYHVVQQWLTQLFFLCMETNSFFSLALLFEECFLLLLTSIVGLVPSLVVALAVFFPLWAFISRAHPVSSHCLRSLWIVYLVGEIHTEKTLTTVSFPEKKIVFFTRKFASLRVLCYCVNLF